MRYTVIEVPNMGGAPAFSVVDGNTGERCCGVTLWRDEAQKWADHLEDKAFRILETNLIDLS